MLRPQLSRSFASAARRSLAVPKPAPALSLADREANATPRVWKGTTTTGGNTPNLIGGEWTVGEDVQSWIDINDPSTQRMLTRVPETSHASMVKIVDKAEQAFLEWRETSVLRKQGVMLRSG